ncbi:MAG: hypothetical protein RIR70_805 [Pseudomonadota bacterium]
MQKKLIVAALAGLAAAPAFAQSNVTVYGRINTSLESESQSATRTSTVMRSNGSRIGFRGAEDLGNGLKAIFGIEQAINSENGVWGSLGRNAYVGLDSSGAGSLIMGRLDATSPGGAPVYSAFAAVWNDINHDTGATGFTQSNGVEAFTGDVAGRAVLGIRTRASNAVAYSSPTLAGGLKVSVRYAMLGTDNGVQQAQGTTSGAESDRSETEVGAVYKTGPLTVSAGYTSASNKADVTPGTARFDDRFQLGASYNLGFANVGAIYAKTNYEGNSSTSLSDTGEWGVSFKVPFGKSDVVANYVRRELQTKLDGDDRVWQVGYGYAFSNRTRGFVFYQNRDFDTSASGTASDDAIKTVGVGVRHNF